MFLGFAVTQPLLPFLGKIDVLICFGLHSLTSREINIWEHLGLHTD